MAPSSIRPFLLILLLLTSAPALAWRGEVVGISDGDTITVMHLGRGEKLRLYGIDTPEKSQAFGQQAKKFTASLVARKTVRVEPVDKDRYGRTVAIVHVGDTCLNEALLESGFAWLYERFCKHERCAGWRKLMATARAAKRGLWQDAAPQPPWDWRRAKRTGAAPAATSPAGGKAKPALPAGPLHGNVRSHVFHRPGCDAYECKNCTAVFGTREDAIRAGFRPCGSCKP